MNEYNFLRAEADYLQEPSTVDSDGFFYDEDGEEYWLAI